MPPLFDTCLAHVLVMEGGWTNDPADPGGPTNLGITLADFARYKQTPVTADTSPALIAELRTLTPTIAAIIYNTDYWIPAACADLPPAIALMHFDAAVNHGVGTAAHMLQQAVCVAVDGAIGPDTLAACQNQPASKTLDAYADIRRVRYRALSHFWRFGRGWLARVDATLAASRRLLTVPTLPRKDTPMPDTSPQTTPKWWGDSMTIWGTLITAVSTVLPVLGPLIGLDITPDLIKLLGANVVATIQAVSGLVGTIMAIAGRARAVQPLIRREVRLML